MVTKRLVAFRTATHRNIPGDITFKGISPFPGSGWIVLNIDSIRDRNLGPLPFHSILVGPSNFTQFFRRNFEVKGTDPYHIGYGLKII